MEIIVLLIAVCVIIGVVCYFTMGDGITGGSMHEVHAERGKYG